eukprot:gb/GEZN01022063.1/.p1 GENE.gb/GEZN01022063.1/~~gb/GEZN01022063.1/.p1  ORF type:complete len:132 (-),score=1.21 gb/GEZN01022063.1/:180-575(-)
MSLNISLLQQLSISVACFSKSARRFPFSYECNGIGLRLSLPKNTINSSTKSQRDCHRAMPSLSVSLSLHFSSFYPPAHTHTHTVTHTHNPHPLPHFTLLQFSHWTRSTQPPSCVFINIILINIEDHDDLRF